jgi:adhesin/invasin
MILNPTIIDKSARFMLSWNNRPKDIDLYLKNMSNGQIVYYKTKSFPPMKLDIDKTQGFGPETITLSETATGLFWLYAINFSKTDGALYQSGAKVEVFNSDGLLNTINIPTAPHAATVDFWDILVYDADARKIVKTNNSIGKPI